MSRLLLFAIAITFAGNIFASDCISNQALISQGFIIHEDCDFKKVAEEKTALLKNQAADFVFDLSSRWDDITVRRPLEATSWDRLSTPRDEMFGDLLLIMDLDTGAPVEIRWYDGQKHVAYDHNVQECANENLIPYAVNALF